MTSRHDSPTELQIEEYVLGRLSAEQALELQRHIETSEEARALVERCREDLDLISRAAAAAPPQDSNLTVQELALFLDDALAPDERARVEATLAVSASSRNRLVQLFREARMAGNYEGSELEDMPGLAPPENTLSLADESRTDREQSAKNRQIASTESTEQDCGRKRHLRGV